MQPQISPSTAVSKYFGAERLTLHMSNGRKQDFKVETAAGECVATGGPY